MLVSGRVTQPCTQAKQLPKLKLETKETCSHDFAEFFRFKRTVTVFLSGGKYNKFPPKNCPNPFRRTNYQLHQSMFHLLICQTNGVATDLIPKNLTVKDTMKNIEKLSQNCPERKDESFPVSTMAFRGFVGWL